MNIPASFHRCDRREIIGAIARKHGRPVRVAVSDGQRTARAYAGETDFRQDYADTTVGWIMAETTVRQAEALLEEAVEIVKNRHDSAYE